MDTFFNYITKHIDQQEVDIWFNMNNILPEKMELFSDFCISVNNLINETYLGEEIQGTNETKINLSEEDKKKHFDWCWDKTVDNFGRENIKMNKRGEHYDYLISFFLEIYYNQKEPKIRNSTGLFFSDLFNTKEPFTKSDLDMLHGVYKSIEKNII